MSSKPTVLTRALLMSMVKRAADDAECEAPKPKPQKVQKCPPKPAKASPPVLLTADMLMAMITGAEPEPEREPCKKKRKKQRKNKKPEPKPEDSSDDGEVSITIERPPHHDTYKTAKDCCGSRKTGSVDVDESCEKVMVHPPPPKKYQKLPRSRNADPGEPTTSEPASMCVKNVVCTSKDECPNAVVPDPCDCPTCVRNIVKYGKCGAVIPRTRTIGCNTNRKVLKNKETETGGGDVRAVTISAQTVPKCGGHAPKYGGHAPKYGGHAPKYGGYGVTAEVMNYVPTSQIKQSSPCLVKTIDCCVPDDPCSIPVYVPVPGPEDPKCCTSKNAYSKTTVMTLQRTPSSCTPRPVPQCCDNCGVMIGPKPQNKVSSVCAVKPVPECKKPQPKCEPEQPRDLLEDEPIKKLSKTSLRKKKKTISKKCSKSSLTSSKGGVKKSASKSSATSAASGQGGAKKSASKSSATSAASGQGGAKKSTSKSSATSGTDLKKPNAKKSVSKKSVTSRKSDKEA